MDKKVKWLYKNIKSFDGYMVTFIENMHARLVAKGMFAAYSHNEARFIDRAYYKFNER